MNEELFGQLDEHLKCNELNWLLGAGISYDAKLPLMYPLTNKVKSDFQAKHTELYASVFNPLLAELPTDCHVEHLLSHLGDYAALAERHKDKKTSIAGEEVELATLQEVHSLIINCISDVIRGGYVENADGSVLEEGTPVNPIVCIKAHLEFIDILFNHTSAGIYERRKAANIFTTNYDTLLEDALALNRVPYWDGFSGGAVAYRTLSYGDSIPSSGFRANLLKIHGSIDWYLCDKGYVWRVRDADQYPKKENRVLIYPQATKYVATQQDPFSTQFDLFRKTLNSTNSNVLAVCGYSFGDDHINNEIEFALSKEKNKTVLVAFLECKDGVIPKCLERWRTSSYGKQIFIVTGDGLYVEDQEAIKRKQDVDFGWTFKGMTEILKNGYGV